ncbi:septum site-determining protein MinC [Motiliproteus sp. MSK22-1]|uniref:septum site-determining protein MinC n=1 Tax=Motiliproteus sp. MSK22-1 TaxID=1897630 RepID=UPI0009785F02|nr:septum site-determining protein MinC [Motiliproteus sp. MSK22-1]OMH39300.1 septum site-determining protein MinC [Motiliproteus sp. MSK22-1]
MNDVCFQLKGSAVTAIVLELYRCDFELFTAQLAEKINQAPALFQQSPIVISLEKLEQTCSAGDLQTVIQTCRGAGLQPMAFRAANEWAKLVSTTGLPLVQLGSARSSVSDTVSSVSESLNHPEQETSEQSASGQSEQEVETVVRTVIEEKKVVQSSTLISRPVRSGQQIYAEGDLIILAQVSEGAEVLAAGNIHVYGPLRGRALAGVKGDTEARIFCQSLEAELVSVAGNFKLSDALQGEHWKQSVQVVLDDELLNIIPLK